MATERSWDQVGPLLLTADGTTEGVLQVADTAGFYFGMQVTLKNNTSSQLTVYVKRIVNNTTLWVGSSKSGIDHSVNLSAFTLATASNIFAAEQNKSSVPMEARLLATYETDPVDAWRTVPVDSYGNHYTDTNPLPVAFEGSISIGEVGIVGPAPDKNQLIVNSDGSINVVTGSSGAIQTVILQFNEITSVPTGISTLVTLYTVPPGLTSCYLQRIEMSGDSLSIFSIFKNTTQIGTKRLWWSDFNAQFDLLSLNNTGYLLSFGDVVSVKVNNNSNTSTLGTFESTIQVVEIA